MNRTPSRIGVDLDGVLVDFNTEYAKRLGITLPPGGPQLWDYPKHMGVDPVVYEREWDRLETDTLFWSELPAYANAAEAISWLWWLRNNGHAIYFITSRPSGWSMKLAAEAWLRTHGFNVPTVLFTRTKGPVAKGLELTHFIDDKPENVLEVAEACGPTCEVALYDQPYNAGFLKPGIIRVFGLAEYFAWIARGNHDAVVE
jgi:uncharacterized HAD superfamily protein